MALSLDRRFLSLLLKDSFLSAVAAGTTRAFIFVLSVVVARSAHTREEFGAFSSTLMVVQFAAMLASLGIAQTATQAIAGRAADRLNQLAMTRTFLVGALALACILALGCAAAAPIVLGPHTHIPPQVVYWSAGLGALQIFVGGLEGAMRGLRRFSTLAWSTTGSAAAGALMAVPLIAADGASGGLVTLALFFVAQLALTAVSLGRTLIGPLVAPREALSVVSALGLPTLISGLSWNAAMMIPPLLLLRSESGLAAVATWNAATQLRTLLSFAPIIIVNASLPLLVARLSARTLTRAQALTAVATPTAIAFVAYIPAVAFSRPLMELYGREYVADAPLLVLVMSYVLMQVASVSLYGIIVASGRVWHGALLNACWCAAVFACVPYALRNGIYALAKVYLVTYIPVTVVLCVLAYRVVASTRRAEQGDTAPGDMRLGPL